METLRLTRSTDFNTPRKIQPYKQKYKTVNANKMFATIFLALQLNVNFKYHK